MSVQVSSLEAVVVTCPRPGAVVVECSGEHDLATRAEVAALLMGLLAEYELVVVDVSEAEFIDSSFIHNLFLASSFAWERGTHFRLQYATAPIVRTALEISGVFEQLDCVRSREEALR